MTSIPIRIIVLKQPSIPSVPIKHPPKGKKISISHKVSNTQKKRGADDELGDYIEISSIN